MAMKSGGEIGSDSLPQALGLDHFCTRAEAQGHEVGLLFVVELDAQRDPSRLGRGVRVSRWRGVPPRLKLFGQLFFQTQRDLVPGPRVPQLLRGGLPVGREIETRRPLAPPFQEPRFFDP
jgi:hypothetical protein